MKLLIVGAMLLGLVALTPSPASAAEAFECDGTFTSSYSDVVVPAGASCTLIDSAVDGTVIVGNGSYFQATNTSVSGDVLGKSAQTLFVEGGSQVEGMVKGSDSIQIFVFDSTVGSVEVRDATDKVQVCGTTVTRGNLTVLRSGRDILIGDPLTVDCAGNTVMKGDIKVSENAVDVELIVRGNDVQRGDLRVDSNTGTADKAIQDNTGSGKLRCEENEQPFSATGNAGWDPELGQCAPSPV